MEVAGVYTIDPQPRRELSATTLLGGLTLAGATLCGGMLSLLELFLAVSVAGFGG